MGSFFDTIQLQMAPPKKQPQTIEKPSQSTSDKNQSEDTNHVHNVEETPHLKYEPEDQHKSSHVIKTFHRKRTKSQPSSVQSFTHESQYQFQKDVDTPSPSTNVQPSENVQAPAYVVKISRSKHVKRYKR
jgi:hypothetical protein